MKRVLISVGKGLEHQWRIRLEPAIELAPSCKCNEDSDTGGSSFSWPQALHRWGAGRTGSWDWPNPIPEDQRPGGATFPRILCTEKDLGQVRQKQTAPRASQPPPSPMTMRPLRCLVHPLLSPALSSSFPVQASSFHSTAAASPPPLLLLPIQPVFPEPATFPVSPSDSC